MILPPPLALLGSQPALEWFQSLPNHWKGSARRRETLWDFIHWWTWRIGECRLLKVPRTDACDIQRFGTDLRGETLPQAAFNLEGLSSFQFEVLLMAEIPNNYLVCTNPRNNGRSYLSTGAGFQPSTNSRTFNVMKSIQSFNFQQPWPRSKSHLPLYERKFYNLSTWGHFLWKILYSNCLYDQTTKQNPRSSGGI